MFWVRLKIVYIPDIALLYGENDEIWMSDVQTNRCHYLCWWKLAASNASVCSYNQGLHKNM